MYRSLGSGMRKILISLVCILPSLIFAQQELDKHAEIGFGIGAFNYTGDLAQNTNFSALTPGTQFFYRHNSRDQVSVYRLNLLIGSISGDESTIDGALQQARQLSFSRGVTELSFIYEYDFFNYRDMKNQYYMSPYLFGGAAATVLWGTQSNTLFTIPFGAGLKYKLGDNLNLGLEYGARKTFSDDLDSIQDSDESLSSSTPTDWYYFLGLNLSYTFYKQICPDGNPKICP